jgi:hypothetical protein
MADKNAAYLEDQFHQDMVGIYEVAKKELHYNAGYFIQMVAEHGGLKAAKKLLASNEPSSGFTVLWEHQRLDLSVEALVLRQDYSVLFTDEERQIARARLEEYGYKFN